VLNHDLVLKHNELYLVGEDHTDISRERATGLYARDTRFLAHWELCLNGVPLEPLGTRVLGADRAVIVAGNKTLPADDLALQEPVLPLTIAVEQHVELDIEARVRIVLGNHSGQPLPVTLSLELGTDFRDMFDIRGFPYPQRDGVYLPPLEVGELLSLGYSDRSGAATTLLVSFSQPPARMVATDPEHIPEREPLPILPGLDLATASPPVEPPPRCEARFPLTLEPGASWELLVTLTPVPVGEPSLAAMDAAARRGQEQQSARVTTDHPGINQVMERATADLAMLQTSFPHGRITAAGIPWFVAPFGRDSVIASLQTLHLAPDRARETLRTLAALQGERVDPFREEEPGKILHEMRYGEMARLGAIPHTPYYGSVDVTPLFVMLFAEAVRWTDDDALYRELRPHAQRALEWIEQWGDHDGDGLVEYSTLAKNAAHIQHQGWKDSYDSLHDPAGQPVSGAIALVEVQGYVYAAYRWLADVAARHGDADWAVELRQRAERVRRVVEERFWLPEEGYYAQALDGEKRPVPAIASNPGHLLYCGLPSLERGRLLAARLRQPDLDSGWGVRTLAMGMAAYNPMSYHNGSVWPHDNSLIAAGLARYGEQSGLARIAAAIFTAAERLPDQRLPELYCGFPRQGAAADAPIPYPVSCSPQAWAAGAAPLLVRAMLGLDADPGQGVVRVAPLFPDWLTRVRIDGLEVLGRRFDLEVTHEGDGYRVESDGPVAVAEPGARLDG
jgi:glycogen debranching enzyme